MPVNGPDAPKQRHPLLWVLAGVVVVIIIVAASSAGGTHSSKTGAAGSGTTSTTPAGGHAAAPATPPTTQASQVGSTVKDGDFAFVVHDMTCGAAAAAAVNPDGMGETVPAGAQECMVTMSVSDDKGNAQTFFADDQYAYDAAGHQFSADSDGAAFMNGSNDATQVNPGITISAIVPFQIPTGDQIVRLELHDSAFSGGVGVHL